ncbi:MAG: DUF1330 domain-containing protein [Devosiaceae bacterium]|nr:DUF1330 domain-containing protein [Devosiaceae bacterium MH13]
MPAYFVGEVAVHDPEAYQEYARVAAECIDAFGGRVLAKGGQTASIEGTPPEARIVIVEFPDFEAATAFQKSEAYQNVVHIRRQTATARAYVVDGWTS